MLCKRCQSQGKGSFSSRGGGEYVGGQRAGGQEADALHVHAAVAGLTDSLSSMRGGEVVKALSEEISLSAG